MPGTSRFTTSILALVLILLTLSHGAPVNEERAIPPSLDDFYTPPIGFESEAPGTILRQRIVLASFLGIIPNPVETHQLLYRTTAIDGSPIATVTTIFKPLFAKSDRFVSFQTAYDSAATICNPSYNYQLGAVQTDLISAAEALILEAYLLSGYIVSSSDYEGPDAAFAAGRLEGMGVLDSIRAVNNFKHTLGLSADPMVVGVGYSGGALATGWAASLHPTYAPELNVKGWVCGGTPANITGTLVFVDDTIVSGFLPIAIDGLNKPSSYGAQVGPFIDEIATAKGQQVLDIANNNCVPVVLLAYFDQSILSTDFQSLGSSLLYDPRIVPILQDGVMGQKKSETPKAPVFLYHASQDEIVPFANASTLAKEWCDHGASVTFTTLAAGGHVTTEVIGLPDALRFTANAFSGDLGSGCTFNTVYDDSLDPLALGLNLEPIGAALAQVVVDAGKQDLNILTDLTVLTG